MSTLTVWDVRPTARRRYARPSLSNFDTAFDTFARRTFTSPSSQIAGTFVPAAEVTRDGEDALVRLEIPGIDAAKDVSVEVNDRRLVINGERRDERSNESGERTVREVRYGSFSRSFTLPKGVSAEAVSANYDAGVLNVRVAGAYAQHETPPAQRIEITSNAPARVEAVESNDEAAASAGEQD